MGGEVIVLMGLGLRCGRMMMVRVGIGAGPALWVDGLGECLFPPIFWEGRLLGGHPSSRLGQVLNLHVFTCLFYFRPFSPATENH